MLYIAYWAVSSFFLTKTQKALRLDSLIEKKVYVQARKRANTTPYNSTQQNYPRGAAGEHPEPPASALIVSSKESTEG
jgi:hypothetical protein